MQVAPVAGSGIGRAITLRLAEVSVADLDDGGGAEIQPEEIADAVVTFVRDDTLAGRVMIRARRRDATTRSGRRFALRAS